MGDKWSKLMGDEGLIVFGKRRIWDKQLLLLVFFFQSSFLGVKAGHFTLLLSDFTPTFPAFITPLVEAN